MVPASQRRVRRVNTSAAQARDTIPGRSGTLVFDLPGPHGRIAYAPNFDSQALGYWRY